MMHKPISLCLLLTLTACGGGGSPAPLVPVTPPRTDFIQPTSIEGTVEVVSVASNATIRLRSDNGLETLSSAAIKSVGGQYSFSLPLPSATLVSKLKSSSVYETFTFGDLLSGGDCTGNINISSLETKIYRLEELELVEGPKTTKLSTVILATSGGVNNFWVYSPSSVSVSGTLTCPDKTTAVANVYLKPGWNAVQASLSSAGFSIQSVDPAKTVWRDN